VSKPTPAQAKVLALFKQGWTLRYQPQRAWVGRHYFLLGPDGRREEVSLRMGNALFANNFVRRVEVAGATWKDPWTFAVV